MKPPKVPDNEAQRLDDLYGYSILDTLPEEEYDNLAHLASFICGTPISLISLVDENRQWFKARVGLDAEETSREVSFCAHAINEADDIFIVPNSLEDDRFHDNPIVQGDPNVIFYAGVPLKSDKGLTIGTLCVIDNKPRELQQGQIDALKVLGNQVRSILEKRVQAQKLKTKNLELANKNKSLESFARVAAHDIKSPLNNISKIAQMLCDNLEKSEKNAEVDELLSLLQSSSGELSGLIDGILKYSKDSTLLKEDMRTVDLRTLLAKVTMMLDPDGNANISLVNEGQVTLYTNEVALQQILLNVISNSLKYNDKPTAEVDVRLDQSGKGYQLSIQDNGPGVPEEEIDDIFEIFRTTSNKDKDGNKGTGIGLATVKSLVEGMNASVSVQSKPDSGLLITFFFEKT